MPVRRRHRRALSFPLPPPWSSTGAAGLAADGSVRALGKCLDVSAASTADGAKVQLWDCNGTGAQRWTATAGHDLVNPNANKCLDVTGTSSADATRLQIWTCTGGANQKWTVPAGGTTPPPAGAAGMQVAPYYYNGWGSPPDPATVMAATGVRWFTMAFVLSNGACDPQWDGYRPLTGGVDQATVNAIRAGGGDVVPSFGGASGTKLETSCSSAAALAGSYQRVITAYGLRAIGIDIETDAYSNPTVQQRTVDALKIVRSANPGITLYVTFPADQNGPDATMINRAAARGLAVDGWTIMPFDFGGNGQDVSVAHFRTMLAYAQAHHLARLTFWSVNRDRPCTGGAADSCGGVAQSAWDYTRVFAAYRG